MNHLFTKILVHIIKKPVYVVLLSFLFNSSYIFANVTITAPNIEVCGTLPTAYSTLGNIVFNESNQADFAASTNKTIIFTIPTNFEFLTGTGSVSFVAAKNLTAATIAVTTTTITITYSSTGTAKTDIMTISGIQVKGITAYSIGNITRTGGTGTVAGLVNTSIVGSLSSTALCYCSPSMGTGYPINNVTFAGINNSVANSGVSYENFTGLTPGNVTAGTTYPISVTATGLSPNNFYGTVFFDWNADGDFVDAGEDYQLSPSPVTVTAITYTGNIAVPASATIGTTRMRVFNKYNTIATPCFSGGSNGQAEDYSVTIVAPISCAGMPNAGTISPALSNITTLGNVVLSWSEAYQTGMTFQWQSGASSTGPWTNIGGATSNTYNVSGLSAGTTYFHLVTICTNSGLSSTSSTAQVNVTLGYCTPGNLDCSFSDQITRVRFGTLDNSSGTTCTATTGYSDYTGLAAPSFVIGTSNNLTINVGTGTGLHSAGVWIDYNQNGSFLDPGEFTSIAQNTISPSTATTIAVLIPTSANIGSMRMRIQYAYGSAVLSSWTCFTNATYGETEDYMITLNCGATPTDITGRFPANGLPLPCGSAATLTWNTHTCATGFKVYMDTNPSPTTLVANSTNNSYYSGNLLSNTTYYWKIVPFSGGGDGASSIWSFTTQTSISVAISQDTAGCTDGGLCLVASSGAFPDYYWYDIPVSGTLLASGSTYCPTGLTTPTTFYVSNVLQGPASSINASTTSNVVCSGPAPSELSSGMFFDVKAKSANVTVTSLDLMFEPNDLVPGNGTTNRNVKVYYRVNSYAGNSNSPAGWILIDNLTVALLNTPTAVTPINITDVFIPAGSTYGFYVVYNAAIQTGAGLYTNSDVEIATGAVACGGEFSSVFPDLSFRGTVHYKISCSSPTVPVLATPWVSSAQIKIALSTVINAKEQCTESGWTYYADPATKNDWLFAIKKNGNSFTADVDIVETPSVYSNINVAGKHGSFLISRYWNVRVTSGSVVTPVDVRYFFDTAEVRAAYNMRNLERTTNYPTSFDVPWRWFKSIGSDFNPAVGINGNTFTFSNYTPSSVNNLSLLGATYTGYINNVPYVEFTGVPSFSGGTGGYGFTTFAGGSLPVKLVDFNATLENNIVKLTWITETEINNDYFTVERSKDGVNFETVEVVESKNGNSNITLNYTLNDNYPYKGVSYYRLKQTDNDGKSEYFKTVSVNVNSAFENVAVYPNPVTGNGFLSFKSSDEKDQTITIYDVAGRLVFSKKYIIEVGDNKITLETSNLTKGMYFIRMDDTIDGINLKFIKE